MRTKKVSTWRMHITKGTVQKDLARHYTESAMQEMQAVMDGLPFGDTPQKWERYAAQLQRAAQSARSAAKAARQASREFAAAER